MEPRATKSEAMTPPPESPAPNTAGDVARASPPSSTAPSPGELELGYVAGVFGFRGDVRLHLHNPASSTLRRPTAVTLVSPAGVRAAATLSARPGAGKRILGRVDGVDTEDGARALVGFRVVIAARALPKPGKDEYYVRDLEGLAVFVAGESVAFGRIAQVHGTGVTDVFEIAVPGLREPVFVPFLKRLVAAVDVAGGRVTLTPDAVADLDRDDRPSPDAGDDAEEAG